MLAVLVEMLCDFQWRTMEDSLSEGSSSLMTLCLELAAMTAICNENAVARDFYLSAYTHSMTLNIIRVNDQKKAQKLFAPYCTDWTEQDFATAETLVSGIEYATLMNTPASPALPVRLAGALNGIMRIYNVPQTKIDECIQKVLQLNYQSIGRRVLDEFKSYVHGVSEDQLKQYLLKQ